MILSLYNRNCDVDEPTRNDIEPKMWVGNLFF